MRRPSMRAAADPGYPPRRPAPGRGHRPPPDRAAAGDDDPRDRAACPASRRSAAPRSASPPRTAPITACSSPARPIRSTSAIYFVDHKFFETMGIQLVAGRTFDQNRPMDDADLAFPDDPAAIRAPDRAGRRQRRDQRARRPPAGLPEPGRTRSAAASAPLWPRRNMAWCRSTSSASSGIRASARSASRSIRSCSRSTRPSPPHFVVRLDGRCRSRAVQRRRGGVEAAGPRRALRREVQRGHHPRALQGGGVAGEGVRGLRRCSR